MYTTVQSVMPAFQNVLISNMVAIPRRRQSSVSKAKHPPGRFRLSSFNPESPTEFLLHLIVDRYLYLTWVKDIESRDEFS